jgi:hypothetical protein
MAWAQWLGRLNGQAVNGQNSGTGKQHQYKKSKPNMTDTDRGEPRSETAWRLSRIDIRRRIIGSTWRWRR